jgi:RNA recognition motif-containing protein
LFVGGLAWATRDETLKAHFEQSGEVTDAKVIMERDTGRSRGFGFVTFADAETATKARDALNGSDLDGRSIRVDSATERPDRGGRDGGGGGGGGRDGGGGGGGGRW